MTPDQLMCATCQMEAPFECFDDCLACSASVIALDPRAWNSNRKFYVGAAWLPVLEREVARQRDALATINLRVRQAS